ncbi:MAG: hypothetical protein MR409_04905 [Lachnospiraceae bacterium]|nr:hypothetical protein [Lachnospiraceae bacterium]
MSRLNDNSELLEEFEKEYKRRRIIDIHFFKKCKQICKKASIAQLKHAKYVLDEFKILSAGNDAGVTQTFTILSLAVAMISIMSDKSSLILNNERSAMFFNITCGTFLVYIVVAFVLFLVHKATVPGRRRNEYYYSIICDEIDKRKETL